jgi:dolichol-phosphate mannosyltransferase
MGEPENSVRVTVIVPTLNEVENIDSLLAGVLAQASPELYLEVFVADGGSTDGTVERVRSWEGKRPVRLISFGGRRGLAGDVLAAAEQSSAAIIVVMDADFSHPPASIPQLVAPILAGESDMVVGSRYLRGGLTPDWPLRRYILSRLGGMLAWPLTDLKDPMSGFFAVRREHVLAVDPTAAGFKIGLEIMAAGGDALRVSEVPITFSDRVHGTSKIGLLQVAAYARRLMVLAGGAVSMGTAARFATVGLLGIGVDLLVFNALFAAGLGMVVAHVASFALTTFFNYALNSRWSFAESARIQVEPDWHRYLRFLAVCLLALFLRGGVLAIAAQVWGWPPELAILPGIAAAAAINYVGSAFFVFPSLNPRVSRTVRWRMAALGILAYVVGLRLIFMGAVDLLPEEAYYWNYAQHLDIGYLDHPPMVAWLIWLGTNIFGQTEFGVRSGAALCWLVAALFSFQFARNLYGKTAAFIAILLFSALPFFFAMGLLMMPDAPLTAAWAGALYFLERAVLAERSKAWLGVGVCIGLGMLSKYTIALLGPATFIFVLLDARSRRWLWSPWPYLAAVIVILLFSPVIAWNAAHDWASFAFQSTRRLSVASEFSLHVLIGSILLLITPLGFTAAISTLTPAAGLRRVFHWPIDRKQAFISVYTLTPLSVFVVFSLFHHVKPNWTGPLWLAVLPAVAHMIATERRGALSRGARAWGATVAIALLVYGLGLHYMALGLPGVPYPHSLRGLPIAWREFADAAEEIADHVEVGTGRQPLLVGMDAYYLASELAFYRHDRDNDSVANTTSRGLFRSGGRSGGLMYDYWPSGQQQNGRTVIMFDFEPEGVSDGSISTWFQELGPVRERIVYKAGAPAGRFYYRVGHGFRPSLHSAIPTASQESGRSYCAVPPCE